MAISNCLFSPTLEIPAEFPTWFVLAKLRCFAFLSLRSSEALRNYS